MVQFCLLLLTVCCYDTRATPLSEMWLTHDATQMTQTSPKVKRKEEKSSQKHREEREKEREWQHNVRNNSYKDSCTSPNDISPLRWNH